MPKAGDKIISKWGTVCTVVSAAGDFVHARSDISENDHAYPFGDWCFADPAVEAQRLQEAAWRADTSPFPEAVADRVKYPANFPVNIQDILENILDDMIPCGNSFYDYSLSPSTAASCALEIVPHLLRWQAQQEQK